MLYVADDNDNDSNTLDDDIVHHLLRPHPLDNVSTLSLLSIRLQSPTLLLRITNVHYFNVKYTKTYNSKPPFCHHLLAAVTPKQIALKIVLN